ncbi:MAG: hypothetical protein ACKPGT_18705, partial [Microcystis sp.]
IGPRPVGAKHSDRKSPVSPIGYCPNASPLLFQQTLIKLAKKLKAVGAIHELPLLRWMVSIN